MTRVELKRVICREYCQNFGGRANKCDYCGEVFKNFELAEEAKSMIVEEMMEPVMCVMDAYLDEVRNELHRLHDIDELPEEAADE